MTRQKGSPVLALVVLAGCEAEMTTAVGPRPRLDASPASAAVAIDLGTLGGGYSTAWGINDREQVVGFSTDAAGNTRGFFWSEATGMLSIGTLGGQTSLAFGINDRGQVTGCAATETEELHLIRWTLDGGLTDLGTIPGGTDTCGTAINRRGEITGQGAVEPVTPTAHAFRWTATEGVVDLGTLGVVQGYGSAGWDINKRGDIVGSSGTAPYDPFAFNPVRWPAAGGIRDLGSLGGIASQASGINDRGHIAGAITLSSVSYRAFSLAPGGPVVDLGILPGGSVSAAWRISNRGEVVGYGDDATGSLRPVLWPGDGAMLDLATLGGCCGEARDINSRGQLVGESSTSTGETRATLWRR